MAWVPKVGRHVSYLQTGTRDGIDNFVKRRPAIITAIANDGGVVLRVGHYDTNSNSNGVQLETYGDNATGIALRSDSEQTGVYTSY